MSYCITTTFRVEEKAIVLVPGAQHKCGEQDVRHKRHQRNVQVGGVQVVLGRQILFLAVGRLCDASRPRLVQDGTQDDLELVGHVGIVDVEVVLQIGRFEVACDPFEALSAGVFCPPRALIKAHPEKRVVGDLGYVVEKVTLADVAEEWLLGLLWPHATTGSVGPRWSAPPWPTHGGLRHHIKGALGVLVALAAGRRDGRGGDEGGGAWPALARVVAPIALLICSVFEAV